MLTTTATCASATQMQRERDKKKMGISTENCAGHKFGTKDRMHSKGLREGMKRNETTALWLRCILLKPWIFVSIPPVARVAN